MQKNRTSAELKRLAKGQLLGRYGGFIAAELMYGLLFVAILLFTMFHLNFMSATGTVIYYAILFIMQIIGCLFSVGFTYMYLKTLQGGHALATDVFHGFKQHADKVIIIGFFMTLISNLFMAPYMLLFRQFSKTEDAIFFLAACIFLVIGGGAALYFQILFSLVNFIVLDFPGYGPLDTLKQSIAFIKGHKGRYFYIMMSFIPLVLLSYLTCGIGFLWLAPYMGMTYTNFYMDLMQSKRVETEVPASTINVAV